MVPIQLLSREFPILLQFFRWNQGGAVGWWAMSDSVERGAMLRPKFGEKGGCTFMLRF